jgi:hypothetical protein
MKCGKCGSELEVGLIAVLTPGGNQPFEVKSGMECTGCDFSFAIRDIPDIILQELLT